MKTSPVVRSRMLTGALLRHIHDTFGERISYALYDPRCPLWFFDILRFNIRGGEPTWIMDGELLFRGCPKWEDLELAIKKRLT